MFVEFLRKIGYRREVSEHLPVHLKSPNAIDPGETFTAFLISVLAGARRFAHTSLMRADRALRALLGIKRFPPDDTIRNLFKRFGQGMVVREEIQEREPSLGRKLLEVPGYTFRVFVTNLAEPSEAIWRDCNQRASVEQRIEELKFDLAADDFCLREFFATEAAFLSILMLFNLRGEFQRASGMTGYRQQASLRVQVFLCGAILGRAGHRTVLHLSAAWGGLEKRNCLLDSLLHYEVPISPKLGLQPLAGG